MIVSVRVCMLTLKWHGPPFSTHFRSSSAFALLDAKPWGLLCPGPAVGSVSSECISRNCCHSTENSYFILFSFLFNKLSSMIYAWFFSFHCPALGQKLWYNVIYVLNCFESFNITVCQNLCASCSHFCKPHTVLQHQGNVSIRFAGTRTLPQHNLPRADGCSPVYTFVFSFVSVQLFFATWDWKNVWNQLFFWRVGRLNSEPIPKGCISQWHAKEMAKEALKGDLPWPHASQLCWKLLEQSSIWQICLTFFFSSMEQRWA